MRNYSITVYKKDENIYFTGKANNLFKCKAAISYLLEKDKEIISASIFLKKGYWNKTKMLNWTYFNY